MTTFDLPLVRFPASEPPPTHSPLSSPSLSYNNVQFKMATCAFCVPRSCLSWRASEREIDEEAVGASRSHDGSVVLSRSRTTLFVLVDDYISNKIFLSATRHSRQAGFYAQLCVFRIRVRLDFTPPSAEPTTPPALSASQAPSALPRESAGQPLSTAPKGASC